MSNFQFFTRAGAAVVLLVFSACGSQTALTTEAENKPLYWVNPMDPSIRSEVFMKDPMGMDYLPVFAEAEEQSKREGLESAPETRIAQVRLSENQGRLIGLRTDRAVLETWYSETRAVGLLKPDPNRQAHLSARIPGRIEELFVLFPGQTVRRGEPLMRLYSPDLFTAQQEFLQLRGTGFLDQGRDRLMYWGLTAEQVNQILQSGRPESRMTLTAPISGTVTAAEISAGMYVEEGQMLFGLADLSRLWVEAELFETALGRVTEKSRLEITAPSLPGWWAEAVPEFISPLIDPETRTFRIRASLDNRSGLLKPGQVVDISIFSEGEAASVVVPRSAVLDTGQRQILYVKTGADSFEGRRVLVGDRNRHSVQILEGLSPDEEIVVAGLFLLDSQAQLADVGYKRN